MTLGISWHNQENKFCENFSSIKGRFDFVYPNFLVLFLSFFIEFIFKMGYKGNINLLI